MSADARVLDEARGARAMTWVMAIMLFLTLLAAAAGLGVQAARASLARQLAGRLTVETTPAEAPRILARLTAAPEVKRARAVSPEELQRLLRPWLGGDAADPELPIPALIDVDLSDDAQATAARAAAIARHAAPDARVDRHESWMSPVADFMTTIVWLAGALVLLMVGATTAVVTLAARAGLETHRETIEVMHMLGSTDRQIARLFQRRIALDAAVGGAVGGLAALAVLLLVGRRAAALGSDLLGAIALAPSDWALVALLPFVFVALATLVARVAITARLARAL